MIANFWLLSVSLLLLWFPRPWLRWGKVFSRPSSRRKKRSNGHAQDATVQFRKELLKLRNWMDFFRALAAGLAVSYLCFDQNPEATKLATTQIFLLQVGVFLAGVLFQSVRFGPDKLVLVAPIFFMLGLSFGLIGWKAALFACVAGFILSRVLPSAGVFLFAFAVLELGFGLMLPGAPLKSVLLAVALAMTPVLLSGVMKRHLVWLNRSQTKPM